MIIECDAKHCKEGVCPGWNDCTIKGKMVIPVATVPAPAGVVVTPSVVLPSPQPKKGRPKGK